ncbi:hypothetical protein PAXRUDRAFT_21950 [Paxillus rubicundulus Ve08.2h10]|uniref:Uncharacterized protein n=1 Tax=Paxillus rubicundulus Ve08.2h10 TaxID=930991 RepID=A0A0D0D6H7_9AGAM|nr:hypothetical protein PAXRUDRAFT_21950 [Paxillus rubicundulus Ve08.2h10]
MAFLPPAPSFARPMGPIAAPGVRPSSSSDYPLSKAHASTTAVYTLLFPISLDTRQGRAWATP